jgi:hypothetical protein
MLIVSRDIAIQPQINRLTSIQEVNAMPVRPTDQENEYFAKLEYERRKQALEQDAGSAGEGTWQDPAMAVSFRCPKCGAELIEVTYKGVEIDKCSRCSGLWLDCGELKQVMEGEEGFLGSLKRIFT